MDSEVDEEDEDDDVEMGEEEEEEKSLVKKVCLFLLFSLIGIINTSLEIESLGDVLVVGGEIDRRSELVSFVSFLIVLRLL